MRVGVAGRAEFAMKQLIARPVLFAVTVLACGALGSGSRCGPSSAEAAQAKPVQPTAARAASRSTPRTRHHAAIGRGASRAAHIHAAAARRKSRSHASTQLASERHRKHHVAAKEQKTTKKRGEHVASRKDSKKTSHKAAAASRGLASFYSDDAETASGEVFDAGKLTAAHPTLPFGTRLRVTNVRNGRSVTVRVNDRGPFKPGRVVDITLAAAEALGMVEAGVVNVTLDVVQ